VFLYCNTLQTIALRYKHSCFAGFVISFLTSLFLIIAVGFIKFLAVWTVYTGVSNYVCDSMEASAKANEEKMDAHYRAKFAAEAAQIKA
jgi:hypothetical protein